MSERIRVKRNGDHRGWVQYAGIDVVDDIERDEWVATREFVHSIHPGNVTPIRPGIPTPYEIRSVIERQTFSSRELAIRWLVE